MALNRYFLLSVTLTLVSCDKMFPEKKAEDKKELVTPEEKKALDKFGNRLPEA
ncbi:MAG: hypothetical protein ACI9FG_000897 [Crocinitomicaceae bacterium]|jgi:hypothetical protein